MFELPSHLHPMVVHFPIALFIAALGFDVSGLIFKKPNWHRTAVHLYILATLLTPLVLRTGICGEIPVTGEIVPQLVGFDQFMCDLLRDHNIPGGSLCISRNGKIIYARGFGWADREKEEPVQPDSLFRCRKWPCKRRNSLQNAWAGGGKSLPMPGESRFLTVWPGICFLFSSHVCYARRGGFHSGAQG